jgi:hypothetical protein
MILTDVKLNDGGYAGPWDLVVNRSVDDMELALRLGISDLVITMHDSNTRTASKLGYWLDKIKEVVGGTEVCGRSRDPDVHMEFVNSRAALLDLLRAKTTFMYPGD